MQCFVAIDDYTAEANCLSGDDLLRQLLGGRATGTWRVVNGTRSGS